MRNIGEESVSGSLRGGHQLGENMKWRNIGYQRIVAQRQLLWRCLMNCNRRRNENKGWRRQQRWQLAKEAAALTKQRKRWRAENSVSVMKREARISENKCRSKSSSGEKRSKENDVAGGAKHIQHRGQ
jgi:hypothetical protein